MAANVPRGIAVVDIGATNSKVVLFDPSSQRSPGARRRPSTTTVRPIGTSTPSASSNSRSAPRRARSGSAGRRDRRQRLRFDARLRRRRGRTGDAGDGLPRRAAGGDRRRRTRRSRRPFPRPSATPGRRRCRSAANSIGSRRAFPEAFARVRTIMTWSQYLAFRLGGRQTTEITALGAFSQLLDVLNGDLVVDRSAARLGRSLCAADARLGRHRRAEVRISVRRILGPRAHPLRRPRFRRQLSALSRRQASTNSRCCRPEPSSSGSRARPISGASIPIATRSPSPMSSAGRSAAADSSAAASSTSCCAGARRRRPRSRRSVDHRARRLRAAVIQRHRRSGRRQRQSRPHRRAAHRRAGGARVARDALHRADDGRGARRGRIALADRHRRRRSRAMTSSARCWRRCDRARRCRHPWRRRELPSARLCWR